MDEFKDLIEQIHEAGRNMSDVELEEYSIGDVKAQGFNGNESFLTIETPYSICKIELRDDKTVSEMSCDFTNMDPEYYYRG